MRREWLLTYAWLFSPKWTTLPIRQVKVGNFTGIFVSKLIFRIVYYYTRMNASVSMYPTRIHVFTYSVSVINFNEWFYDSGGKSGRKANRFILTTILPLSWNHSRKLMTKTEQAKTCIRIGQMATLAFMRVPIIRGDVKLWDSHSCLLFFFFFISLSALS